MPINILVIDDDKKIVSRLMNNLRRADHNHVLGVIEVDDSIVQLNTVEEYNISQFDTAFDVALIDYQLTSSFTGILVSAWIALYLRIPRITLSTADYPGDPSYFNASILKREITDTPEVVIQRIQECVDTYNSDAWLDKQHRALVKEYQTLLRANNTTQLTQLETILDRFERILDAQQDSKIQAYLAYEHSTGGFLEKEKAYEMRFNELYSQLQQCQEALKND